VRRKLLLADDSTTIRRVIELTFSAEDVDVVSVDDGEQAIQRIPLEEPDIVLADIAIAKRNGYDVAEFVKEHPGLSHVPVLLLTGAFEPVDEARARQVKAAGVVVKPFEPHLLVARVRELVDTARSQSRQPGAEASSPRSPMHPPAPESSDRIEPAAVPPAGAGSTTTEPSLPAPQMGGARAESSSTSLDDYFDRLDAAFQTLGASQSPRPPAPRMTDDAFDADVPTIEDVLSGAPLQAPADVQSHGRVAPPPPEPADSSSTLAPSAGRRVPPAPRRPDTLADLFALLLAIEQGEANAGSLRLEDRRPLEITDELVDAVTHRVLERLAPDTVREVVEEIVLEVAERLVREEIDRIKRG
jgi:CheY-like chemotaxis protein